MFNYCSICMYISYLLNSLVNNLLNLDHISQSEVILNAVSVGEESPFHDEIFDSYFKCLQTDI